MLRARGAKSLASSCSGVRPAEPQTTIKTGSSEIRLDRLIQSVRSFELGRTRKDQSKPKPKTSNIAGLALWLSLSPAKGIVTRKGRSHRTWASMWQVASRGSVRDGQGGIVHNEKRGGGFWVLASTSIVPANG